MYLTKKSVLKQEYIVMASAAFLALVLIGGFYMVFTPMAKELFLLNTKIKKGRQIAPDVSGYRTQYAQLEAKIEELKQEVAKSKERLFWKKDIALFLEKLTHIAAQLAVDFITIKPNYTPEPIKAGDESETVLMYKHNVTITLKTGYRELISFLSRIEASDSFLRIDTLTVEPDSKDVLSRNVTIVLSLFSVD